MTIAAIKQELLSDLHSLVDETSVNRKIVAAMRFHREKRLWFSERTFSFTLEAGVANYSPGNGIPPDLVEIVGKTLWVLIDGSQDSRFPCTRVPSAELEWWKQDGTGQSHPEIWDWHANQLRFYPIPSSTTTDVVEGRYVKDIGVPVVKWEASAFKFYSPDGLRLLSSTELDLFNNDWTDPLGAYHMVKARAGYLLCKEFLHDAEQAESYLSSWLEQVAVLENETEAKTAGATEIVGCIL